MNALKILTLGGALIGFLACSQPTTAPVTTAASAKNAPTWIDNEKIPDGLAAVGIAQANAMGDKSMQRTTALADAREKLAGKLRVRVQNMFSKLDEQVTTASADGKKPIKSDVMQRVIQNVTRQLINQDLQGAMVRQWWLDPADQNLYCFLVMTKESLDRALAGEANSAIRKEIAQGEVSLNKALDKLDAAIAATEPAGK
jgi:hypothetical protein